MEHEHSLIDRYDLELYGPCKNCGLKEELWDKIPECPAKNGPEGGGKEDELFA